ncbi:CG13078 [Drosophila busckii]|uniref:ascorbate ferrireductase (transmembrane) n=1 Tax=Drosophila busckii TaxID=30019 RepID=A0A0M4EAJ3_DROBS|nr:CG13078 [Drosophila busckii]
MSAGPEKSTSVLQHIEAALNVLNQLCIGFITIWICWNTLRTGLSGIRLHVWLVSFGFIFLMAEGMMCFYDGNWLTLRYSRKQKTFAHVVLQLLGGGMGVAGCLVQLIRDDWSISVTVHSRLGFAAFILCLISLLSGLSAALARSLSKVVSPLGNKTFHIVLSLGTFVTAMLAQFYGYTQTRIFKGQGHDFMVLMQVVTLLVMVLTCIAPFKALYHKFANFRN